MSIVLFWGIFLAFVLAYTFPVFGVLGGTITWLSRGPMKPLVLTFCKAFRRPGSLAVAIVGVFVFENYAFLSRVYGESSTLVGSSMFGC